MKKILTYLATLFLVAGCASQSIEKPVANPSVVEERIADGVTRIASAYEQLALISSAAKSDRFLAGDYNYDEDLLPAVWLTEVELLENYHGDLANFVGILSAMGGLEKPRIDAVGRDQPVIVTVRKSKRKLISFLADVGFQAGDRALVQPDTNLNKVIVSFD